MKIWHLPALAGAFWVVGACGGNSSLGGDEDAGMADEGGGTSGGGGSSGSTNRGGGTNRGGASGSTNQGGMSGSNATGGATANPCAGRPCGAECSLCVPSMGEPATGGNMGSPGVPCDLALRYCSASGECSPAFPVCETQCRTPMDCPVVDLPCQQCADGSVQCPSADCVMGRCISSYPTCGTQCMIDSDCPAIGAPCQMCPDGTASCPKSECIMGRCSSGWPGCGGEEPCAGKECGEPCSPCVGMDCPVSDVAFVCNVDGQCAAEAPRCEGRCMTVMDCPQPELCRMCADGTCGRVDCVAGGCQWTCPPDPEPECMTAADCVADTICRACPDMSCAVVDCVRSQCVSVCPL